MSVIKRLLYIFLLPVLTLSGCLQYSLEPLQEKNLEGEDFSQVLAREYKAYAEAQKERYDWPDSQYFAKKGLRAAKGVTVDPEHPEEWDIPKNLLPTFQEARRDLLDTVDSIAITEFPKQAGRAFFLYDCWLERQEENWVDEHIEPCSNEFYETLARINGLKRQQTDRAHNKKLEEMKALLAEINAEATEEEKFAEAAKNISNAIKEATGEEIKTEEVEEEKAEQPEEQSGYIIFFDFGESEITAEGHQIIGKVLSYLESGNYNIVVNGHSDRVGSENYNLKLSKSRAGSVADVFISQGISEDKIKTFGFGESDPIRQTEDGVRDPVNRRVEVVIEQGS